MTPKQNVDLNEQDEQEAGRGVIDYLLIGFGSAFFLRVLIILLRLYHLGNSPDDISVPSENMTDTTLEDNEPEGMTGSQLDALLLTTFTVGSLLYCCRYGAVGYVSRVDHCVKNTFGFSMFSGTQHFLPDHIELERGLGHDRHV